MQGKLVEPEGLSVKSDSSGSVENSLNEKKEKTVKDFEEIEYLTKKKIQVTQLFSSNFS